MIARLRALFACRHRDYGRAWTDQHGRTYVVCEGCKRRVAYSWSEMRIAGEPAPVVGAEAMEEG